MITILLTACLFISTFTFNANKTSAEDTVTETDDVIFTTLETSEGYSKVKVEDLTKGTVEYLESILVDGEWTQIITSTEGEVLHEIETIGTDIYLDGEAISETVNVVELQKTGVVALEPTFATAAATKWVYRSTTKGNSSWKLLNASIIAGVIATVLKVPAFYASVISVASALKINEMKTTWWSRSNYKDANSNYSTCRTASNTSFYKYSNYTGLIKTSGLVPSYVDACASGY